MTRKTSHWRALGIPVLAACAIAAGSIPATNAAPARDIEVELGDDGIIYSTYDLAIVDPDGTFVQAESEADAYRLSSMGSTIIPVVGTGDPEPAVQFDVVNTTEVTGPVTLTIDPADNDVARHALYTITVDGAPLADHLSIGELEDHPPVIDDWRAETARTIRIEMSLASPAPGQLALEGGKPIGFTTIMRGTAA